MLTRSGDPFFLLCSLVGVALLVFAGLVAIASSSAAPRNPAVYGFHTIRADTDSVHVMVPARADTAEGESQDTSQLEASSPSADTSLADTSRAAIADTLEAEPLPSTVSLPDTSRAARYLGSFRGDPLMASLRPRRKGALQPQLGNYWRHEIKLDSTGRHYIAREFVGDAEVRYPVKTDLETYRRERFRADMEDSWRSLVVQRAQNRSQRRGGLGVNIAIPGGRQSAFTTIFGRPEVDLRVNGQANIDAGFAYQQNDQQVALTGRSSRVDPRFGQNIRLGVTGTIGDKLTVDVNWDTERDFDYQNQLRLEYRGYEDEIIQSVEAGNVSLQTPSTLISGGQSLFGIKSRFQLGGLQLTTVMSQQEGESDELAIEGGSQTTEFEIRPTDYEDNTHFFMGYYFRSTWERAHSNPPRIVIDPGLGTITEVEVWKLVQNAQEREEVSAVIALADLGEPAALMENPDEFGVSAPLPDPSVDQYSETALSFLRSGANNSNDIDAFLQGGAQIAQPLESTDYELGRFRKLRPGQDYLFDPARGYVTLITRLAETEALAIAYRYSGSAGTVTVGDFQQSEAGRFDSDRLVLKLLRGSNQQPNESTWPLTLRNIYNVPGRGINPSDFELQVYYEQPGQTPSQTLPGVTVGQQQTLLQVLGLDRLNEDESQTPNNRFDFIRGFTIDPENGRVIFPYLEPFGNHMDRIIRGAQQVSPDLGVEGAIDRYVFADLYDRKLVEARRISQYDIYRIRGSYRSAVQSTYNLGFFGIVEGSVRVTSGGSPLTPGTDYVVDYSTGSVEITNPAYLSAGRDIRISYERNQFAAIQKKTLLGMHAEYAFRDRLTIGATALRLAEKPMIDKFRVGEEPISNLIWGMQGAWDLDPQWLTRAVDALPLVQTRAPSTISLKGEFAQLRPGHAQTLAFSQKRRELQRRGTDFASDETQGISYLDDFEGVRTSFSLMQPGLWNLSSAPQTIRPTEAITDSLRTNWRAKYSWYTLPQNVYRELGIREVDNSVRRILIAEAFPGRDLSGEPNRELQTFDVHFDPSKRGPYNFTRDMPSFLNRPRDTWGGMMMALPEGYTDFNLQNVDAVEFIFRPFAHNEGEDSGSDAKLFIELGLVSEDVIPNGYLNTEDGLDMRQIESQDLDRWGRRSTGQPNNVVDVDRNRRWTQDLGLNGLPSHNEFTEEHPYEVTERTFYSDFLERMRTDLGEGHPEFQRAWMDPAADDFKNWLDDRYFGDPTFFPNGATVQQRFGRYFAGMELNTIEAQREIARGGTGVGRFPDSEDLNRNGRLDTENRYFQYELPLSRSELDFMAQPGNDDNYVVDRIRNESVPNSFEWYVVRIPVRDFLRKVGNIDDFSRIEFVRIWTTGHSDPVTMRFARFDLVGNQWQKSAVTGNQTNEDIFDTSLFVSTVNNEENSFYQSPPTAVVSQIRTTTGPTQRAREQSMLLRVRNLQPGDQRSVFRTYNQGQDMLRYSNIRMFMHAHGFEDREDVRVFVRLGQNESNDYYEYEQPLSPSSPIASDPYEIWQMNQVHNGEHLDLNSMNVELSALNVLKVSRDEALAEGRARLDSLFTVSGPTVEAFAPPGTRLGIRGNPSLSSITTISIGLRNPADSTSGKVLEDVTVWVNEMRVSGYDASNGWAAVGSANVRLADLATVQATVRRQTDGFGGLASGLGERDNNNISNWGLTTNFNMHKFIPERFGWNIPVTYSIRNNVATPRFSPDRGDIRLDEIVAQIEERQDLDAGEKQRLKNDAIYNAQTASFAQSVSVPISKSRSQSPVLQNTLDALSLNYSFSESGSRNPSTRFNDSWQWSSALNYRLQIRRPQTVRPLWFIEGIPLVGGLGSLRLNYLPQSINASASAQRNFTQTQERARFLAPQANAPDITPVPEIIQRPVRENHRFNHRRTVNIQYNPFAFMSLGYDNNTDQILRTVGLDTLYNVATMNRVTRQDSLLRNIRLNDAIAQGIVDTSMFDAFEFRQLNVIPIGDMIGRLFTTEGGVRTNMHSENFNATLRPALERSGLLNWITVQPITYSGQFQWQNGPVAAPGQAELGASVSNRINIRGGIQIRPQEFWRKFDFYKDLEQQQREAETRARNERTRREQERERRRRERQEARERAAQGEEETGDEVPSDIQTGNETSADTTRSGWRPPLPDPGALARRLFLTITGIRDLSITYTRQQSASSGNVLGGYSVFDPGAAPLAYRLGIRRIIDPEYRVLRSDLQVTDRMEDRDQLGARTSLTPSTHLRVDLNWELGWSSGRNVTYGFDGSRLQEITTRNGSNQSTIWAFGGSYSDLLERQFETFQRDLARTPENEPVGDADGDGRVVLTRTSVTEDFSRSFMRSLGTLGSHGLLPVPLPNWNVNYTGLNQFDLIRRFTRSVTLVHRYTSTYNSDFRSSDISGQQQTTRLGSRTITFTDPDIIPNAIRINERFNPIIGVNIGWMGDLQTDVNWNRASSHALSAGSTTISASETNEISVNASYSKRGLRLPFMRGRTLNNTLRLSLVVSRSQNVESLYRLKLDIENLLAGRELNEAQINATTRLSAEPRISYVFSNRVTADFFLRYEHLDSQGSQIPTTTNVTGGFNVRVSIAS